MCYWIETLRHGWRVAIWLCIAHGYLSFGCVKFGECFVFVLRLSGVCLFVTQKKEVRSRSPYGTVKTRTRTRTRTNLWSSFSFNSDWLRKSSSGDRQVEKIVNRRRQRTRSGWRFSPLDDLCSNMGVRIFSNENHLQMYVQVHFGVQVRT